ncbi:MAG: hypothetical protein LIV24_10080 [Eubacterium sp.]|nr:hypothetical protein [Eubacterium sp.]
MFQYSPCSVSVPEHTGRETRRDFEDRMFFLLAGRIVTRFLLPNPLSIIYTVVRSVPFILKGIHTLCKGRLVPWSLGATALCWLLTRNMTKTLSILMVDYSCALKLAMPISVMSAMCECSDRHINVIEKISVIF